MVTAVAVAAAARVVVAVAAGVETQGLGPGWSLPKGHPVLRGPWLGLEKVLKLQAGLQTAPGSFKKAATWYEPCTCN